MVLEPSVKWLSSAEMVKIFRLLWDPSNYPPHQSPLSQYSSFPCSSQNRQVKKVCSRKSKVHNIVGVMLKVLVTVGCTVPCTTSTNYKTTTYTLHNIVMMGNVPYRYLLFLVTYSYLQQYSTLLLLRKFIEHKLRCLVFQSSFSSFFHFSHCSAHTKQ